MQLSDLVSISLSISNPPNLQTGFATGLITGFSNRLGSGIPVAILSGITSAANGLSQLAGLGYLTTDPEYLAATSYLSALPTPTSMAVGKRNAKVAQVATITVNTATNAHVYTASLYGQTATYTATVPSDTTTTIAAALVTALEALTAPIYQTTTIANTGAVITITAVTAGIDIAVSTSDSLMTAAIGTPAVGYLSDMKTIMQYNLGPTNGNNFVLFSSTGETDVDIYVANTIATVYSKFHIAKSSESGCLNGTDTLYNAIGALGSPTGTMMNYFGASNGIATYADAGLMGGFVTQNPGSYSANLKTIPGTTPDGSLAEVQIAALKAANINFYTTVGTQPFFINGRAADGNGVDIYYGLYAFQLQVQTQVVTAMAALPKFPFTDQGITIIVDAINQIAALFSGPSYNFFSPDPVTGSPYQIFAPTAASFSANQRKTGALTGITFNGRLAGDVLSVAITGQVHY